MNTSTEHLIASLSQDLPPVKRLASPGRRLLGWVAVALPVSLVMGALVERQNMALAFERLSDARSLLELAAILLTALTAGYAALCGAQPGRFKHAWMLPVVPFAGWLALIGESCFRLFEQVGPEHFSFAPHWTCYPSVVATGAAPALVMVILIRRGMLTAPSETVALAVLAASALGAVGLRLFHAPDATALVLMWQLIATVSFLALSSLVSSYLSNRSISA